MNNIYFKLEPDNSNRPPLKVGDKVRYTVLKRINPSKAVIHFHGKKLMADIPGNYPEKGFAVVKRLGPPVELSFLDGKNSKQKTVSAPVYKAGAELVEVDGARAFLLERGVKADKANVEYLLRMRKYLGAKFSGKATDTLVAFMGKKHFPSAERFEDFISGRFFRDLFSVLRKNANGKSAVADKLIKLTWDKTKLRTRNLASSVKAAVSENGFAALWMLLFEVLDESDADSFRRLKELLNLLSANKKENSQLDYKVFPFLMDLGTGQNYGMLELFTFRENGKQKRELCFRIFEEDGGELIELSVKDENGVWKIEAALSDEKVYAAMKEEEGLINREIDKHCSAGNEIVFELIKKSLH